MIPSLGRRYLAIVIDNLVILATIVVMAKIFGAKEKALQSDQYSKVLASSFWFLIICYTPILTSKLATIGQFITGIRIRTSEGERLNLGEAYSRYISKVIFGPISFVTVLFSSHSKAIHDYIVESIVLNNSYITSQNDLKGALEKEKVGYDVKKYNILIQIIKYLSLLIAIATIGYSLYVVVFFITDPNFYIQE